MHREMLSSPFLPSPFSHRSLPSRHALLIQRIRANLGLCLGKGQDRTAGTRPEEESGKAHVLKFDVDLWTAAVLVEDISSPRQMFVCVLKSCHIVMH